MRTYSNNKRQSGGRDNDRGRDRDGDRYGGRDNDRRRDRSGGRGRPEMHPAVCDACGKNCEVPFRPSGDKPIYCSNCFERQDNSSYDRPRRSDSRRDFSSRGPRRDSGRSYGRDSRREKEMFEVVCTECGKDCEVPFKPSGDKPVLCSNCFAGKPGKSDERHDEINEKLDRILKILDRIENAKTWMIEPETTTKDESKKKDKKKKTEKILEKIATKNPAKKAVKKVTKKTAKKAVKKVATTKKAKAKKK